MKVLPDEHGAATSHHSEVDRFGIFVKSRLTIGFAWHSVHIKIFWTRLEETLDTVYPILIYR
jgi:hypothetical protein